MIYKTIFNNPLERQKPYQRPTIISRNHAIPKNVNVPSLLLTDKVLIELYQIKEINNKREERFDMDISLAEFINNLIIRAKVSTNIVLSSLQVLRKLRSNFSWYMYQDQKALFVTSIVLTIKLTEDHPSMINTISKLSEFDMPALSRMEFEILKQLNYNVSINERGLLNDWLNCVHLLYLYNNLHLEKPSNVQLNVNKKFNGKCLPFEISSSLQSKLVHPYIK